MNETDPSRWPAPRPTRRTLLAAGVGAGCAMALPALAQERFPARPITVVVGFPPGTGTDAVTRILAERMAQDLGEAVVVDNRAGVGGSVGAASVARAKPDGYTLLVGASAPMAINPHIYPKLQYDPLADLTGVGMFTWLPFMLVCRPDLPAANLQELIALARKKPGGITYASTGNGTTSHLLMEMIGSRAGVRFTHVPYKGSAQAQTDIMGGQVDCSFDTIVSSLALVRTGKLRALAVSTAERAEAMPQLPTAAEQGLADFDFGAWLGLVAPAATPAAALDRIEKSLAAALQDSGLREKIGATGAQVRTSRSRAEFAAFIRKDYETWGRIVRQFNVRLE